MPEHIHLCRRTFGVIPLAIGTVIMFAPSSAFSFVTPHQSSRRRLTRPSKLDGTGTQLSSKASRIRDIRFAAPLIEEGYPPAVESYEGGTLGSKPLLLYLPGFDGTFMAPFLQLPELSTSFDVRCLTMSMGDRSTYQELKSDVIDFLRKQSDRSENEDDDDGITAKKANFLEKLTKRKKKKPRQGVYLAGESFGGILSLDVALTILEENLDIDLRGLTLINPATCYDRSKLASEGPSVVNLPPFIYPFGLLRLLPLFRDEYALPQLLMILQARALPSVIDSAAREAYMGRVAFSIPSKLKYMPQSTLDWRLNEWLATGCAKLAPRLESFAESSSKQRMVRTLIVVGEMDLCLPSIDEAERLSALFPGSTVHVVEGAGHASTCGARLDLAAVMRKRFPEVKGRREMKATASRDPGVELGMEPRYDGNVDMGLSPQKYWASDYFKKTDPTGL